MIVGFNDIFLTTLIYLADYKAYGMMRLIKFEGYNLINNKFMGGEDSKPTQDDFFLLEHLSKMSLKNRKIISYYLISSHHGPALPPLRQYFKIDTFPSVATLKQ